MAYYYNPPKRSLNDFKKSTLTIQDDAELKGHIGSRALNKNIKTLIMKNSKITDLASSLLKTITQESFLQKIDMSQNFSFVSDATPANLSQCKCLSSVQVLNLADNDVSDKGVEFLTKSLVFANLKQLILYGNTSITGDSLKLIAFSDWMKSLEVLDLHATSVNDQGMKSLMQGQNCGRLKSLNLSMNWDRISDATLVAIAMSHFCKSLTTLNLEDCSIGIVGVGNLCKSENVRNLQNLDISNSIQKTNNLITDQCIKELAESPYTTSIKSLFLKATKITSEGVKYIASSHLFQKLEVLKISHCRDIDANALVYLGNMLEFSELRKIHVNSTSITKDEGSKFESKHPQINIIY